MKKPAARVGDQHSCPMVEPNGNAHKGGPVLPPGSTNVKIAGQPAARVGDLAHCEGVTDMLVGGSASVKVNKGPLALAGMPTTHGGTVVPSQSKVIVGK